MLRYASVLLLLAALYTGCTSNEGATLSGEKLYMLQCASCHQGNGKGLPGIYPPLAGSEWVTGDPQRLVLTVLHGLKGPITVKGQTYEGVMPAQGRRLKPEDITAILNFIRTSWGNQADSIALETVQELAVRVPRRKPWTASELDAFLQTATLPGARN